jgi:hypothetical protein
MKLKNCRDYGANFFTEKEDKMEWNNNNKSCVSTWYYLASTHQLNKGFPNSPNVKMNKLRFWNELSTDITEAKARAWAEWFVSYVTSKDGAQYEKGYEWASSVDAMVKVMTDKTKTVADLAAAVDTALFFYKEVKP